MKIKHKITPFLWFNGHAETAAKFYTGIFKNSKIVETLHYGNVGPEPKGTVMAVIFDLDGQRFYALNAGSEFKFNPSISFFVMCQNQKEIDTLWKKLCSGGGKPIQCGWVTDKFGVCWQIVPDMMWKLLKDKNTRKVDAVMSAMMKMDKLNFKKLLQAAKPK